VDRASIVLCTDGSDLSIDSLRAGLELLPSGSVPIVATVVRPIDWGAIHGTGFAGALVDDAGFEAATDALRHDAEEVLATTAERLDLRSAERALLWGEPGPELCRIAEERQANAILIGTRGHGGFRRALLGSVSDHVVRNATCPVVVASPRGEAATT
jgi:nucleotide-binding universal stress UspA family protein